MKIFTVGVDDTTCAFLEGMGFAAESDEVETPDDLYEWVAGGEYTAVVIDLDVTSWGFFAVRYLRSRNFVITIIGLSRGEGEEPWSEQRAAFLENGGDDYLHSPVNPRELAASLRAMVRRSNGLVVDVREIIIGDAVIRANLPAQTVTVNSLRVHLTGKELAIFLFLASSRGRVLSKEMILGNIYSAIENEPELKIIDVYICKLRKKLALMHIDAGNAIETVWGQGYRINSDSPPKSLVA